MTGGVVRLTVFRFSVHPDVVPDPPDQTTVSWRRRLAAWLAARI